MRIAFLLLLPCARAELLENYRFELFRVFKFMDVECTRVLTQGEFHLKFFLALAILIGAAGLSIMGVRKERYSLAFFVGLLGFTLMGSLAEILKQLIGFDLSAPGSESVREMVAAWSYYIALGAAVIFTVFFLVLHRLVKLVAMCGITYMFYERVLKNQVQNPTGNFGTLIVIIVLLYMFYMALEWVYSVLFAFCFATYGTMFLMDAVWRIAMPAETNGNAYVLVRAVFRAKSWSKIPGEKPLLVWITLIGISLFLQMRQPK